MAILLESANSEYLSRASAPSTNADYTLHLRFRLATTGTRQTLWSADAGTAGVSEEWLYVESDGTVVVRRLNNAGSNDVFTASAVTFSASTDYEIWLVRSGANYLVYLGSSASTIISTTSASTVTAPTRLAFGAESNGLTRLNGAVSDLALWTEAVSNANRALVASGSASAYTTNQWGRWKADTHTALTDLSGNGRDLTANGTLSTVTDPVVPSVSSGSNSRVFVRDLRRRGGRRFI